MTPKIVPHTSIHNNSLIPVLEGLIYCFRGSFPFVSQTWISFLSLQNLFAGSIYANPLPSPSGLILQRYHQSFQNTKYKADISFAYSLQSWFIKTNGPLHRLYIHIKAYWDCHAIYTNFFNMIESIDTSVPWPERLGRSRRRSTSGSTSFPFHVGDGGLTWPTPSSASSSWPKRCEMPLAITLAASTRL